MTDTRHTSYFGNLALIYQTLQTYEGVDADEVLELAGIKRSLYNHTGQRVPAEMMERLYPIALEKTADPSFGLRCIDSLNPANYHALGVGLLYSKTLRDFFQRFERFFGLISTIVKIEFVEEQEWARLTVIPLVKQGEAASHFDSDCLASLVLKFLRLVYKPNYSPLKIDLTWEPSDDYKEKYQNYFGCEINFSATLGAVYIKKHDLDVELPASNVELARQNDKVVVEFLARTAEVDLPSRVYAKLVEILPSGRFSRDIIAQSLHMSTSVFHEKLKKSGTSYQELLDETRKDLAERYIMRAEVSLTEVAYLLGFTDSSNFSRAFRRWVGMSPRAYRTNKLATGDSNTN